MMVGKDVGFNDIVAGVAGRWFAVCCGEMGLI